MSMQVKSGDLRQQAAASTTKTVVSATTEESIVNNVTITALRTAFNNQNAEAFVGVHHSTIKKALPENATRRALFHMMLDQGVEPPKWLESYETPRAFKDDVEEIAQAAVEERPVLHRLISGVDNTPTNLFKPLLLGEDAYEWLRSLAHRNLTNREGSEYSALYGAMVMANSAISALNRRLYAAYLVDLIDHQQFEQAATKVQDMVSAASSAIAAHGNRDATTHGTALMDIRVRAKDQGAEASGKGRLAELREQMQELARDAKASDATLAAQLIEEFQQLQAIAMMRDGHSAHAEDSSDSKPNDTGWTVAAVDSFDHLYSLPVRDVAGMEAEMVRALWTGKGLELPAIGRDDMRERLTEAYANAEEWADASEKSTLIKKIEKRTAFFESGIDATVDAKTKDGEEYSQNLAGYARWAVNHYTRRLWRDIKMLELAKEHYSERLDRTLERIHREETSDIPPVLTRVNMGERQELGYTITLPFIGEFGDEQLDPHATQGERMTTLYTMIIGVIESQLPLLRAMYAEYRELDEAHHVIWALMASDDLPVNYPPIYWNNKGWYMTEEAATEALLDEIAERVASAKDASVEAIAGTLEAALNQVGSLI